jgi:LEA14-like dessication related protein
MNQKIVKRSWVRLVSLAIGITWVASACAGFGKRLEAPQIMLADISGGPSSGLEAVFDVDLRVFNSNDVPLVVRSVDCKLEINGKTFARGISNIETTIPEFGTQIVPVTVYSSILNVLYSAVAVAGETKSSDGIEKLEYRMSGKLHLRGGDVFPTVIPFDTKGELDLTKLSGSTQRNRPTESDLP